MLPRAGKLH